LEILFFFRLRNAVGRVVLAPATLGQERQETRTNAEGMGELNIKPLHFLWAALFARKEEPPELRMAMPLRLAAFCGMCEDTAQRKCPQRNRDNRL